MTKFILIFTTVIKRLPGDFEYPNANEEKELLCRRSRPNFILLVFVGGVTYAEIAAIRYLNKSNKGKFKHKDSRRLQIYNSHNTYYKWKEIY